MGIPAFVLASISPARLHLLQSAGIEPIVCRSDFDESTVTSTDPVTLVNTLAQCKAEAVVAKFRNPGDRTVTPEKPDNPSRVVVLGCDSVLQVDGEIYGKPETPAAAIQRWQKMRGGVGELYTGHALFDLNSDRHVVRCQMTRVYFANISDRQIENYVATEEPLRCAGCFAIDGRGGLFVEKLEGCHTNVIGLSLPLLRSLLEELGYDVTDFWPDSIHRSL
ncbi:nucleoside triphosphate pyrophosphatase [Laspinema olomoucense]|uniref:Nucleoside triphosphate pyrophosphatase n=1 Tax=Laspinema olomoucense D3b TaxID=2953688 RepID=A0ABT2N9F1_9CYAN|nr:MULTISPECIES: nucleoside triphosphate pyrophosphatase [unclassified Laspinema]MCT7974070.1 Maf-like protein [Laspinema sp. D3d]MCT7978479.1 Maf-like protein [Laspinema sp. D3b]MCT7991827.1 Maf-like protein [Laspinema sp. D3a]